MRTVLPLELVDIQLDGYHLFVPVRIGRKNGRLLVDSGASRTVFDEDQLKKLFPKIKLEAMDRLSTGLGSNSVAGSVVKIATLGLGRLKLLDYEAIVLDLSHVNESYKLLGMPAIDGVLGSDLLMKYNALLDYGKKKLTLKEEINKR